MRTKDEVIAKRESVVVELLKTKYKFVYDQILLDAKPLLTVAAQKFFDGELQDEVNEGLHTEHHQGHNYTTSVAVDFESVGGIFSQYQAALEFIDLVYAEDA